KTTARSLSANRWDTSDGDLRDLLVKKPALRAVPASPRPGCCVRRPGRGVPARRGPRTGWLPAARA
ncbi:hypothetical protein AB0P45_26200, partial [Streptomyces niveus]